MAARERTGTRTVNRSRRNVIKAGLAGLVAAGAGRVPIVEASAPAAQSPGGSPGLAPGARLNGPLFFDVETTNGVVRGMANTGIKVFRGIPYGADTSGANRFMPPRKPAPWMGSRYAMSYGPISPQTPSGYRSDYAQLIAWDRHVGIGGMGEDCLSLNVWTPGVKDNARRAVLVSFHGGGWATGSANGPMYDGGQLALLGDVVVVTVNHRLASFGYTHLRSTRRAGGVQARRRVRRDGHGRVARVGARQHRGVRRRPVARDDLRPVRRRLEDVDAARRRPRPRACSIAPRCRAARRCGSPTRPTPRRPRTSSLKKLGLTRNRIADIQRLPWEQLLEAQAGINPGFTPVMDGALPAASSVRSVGAARVARRAADHLDDAGGRGAAADELGSQRRRADGAAQRALRRQGERDSRALPRREPRQDAVSGSGAGLHRQPDAAARDHAGRTQGGAGRRRRLRCTSGNGPLRASTASSARCTATTSTPRFNLYRNGICGSGQKAGRVMCTRLASGVGRFREDRQPRQRQHSRTGRPTTRRPARRWCSTRTRGS